MELLEIMKARHSVRSYIDRPIEPEKREVLNKMVEEINQETGLHLQIIYEEPECFKLALIHYGIIKGARNYICLVGKKSKDLEEKTGYYGEKLVLKAQELGLNTCWVALTRGKSQAKVNPGEKVTCVIALGYGSNQGTSHKNKDLKEVCNIDASSPDWFKLGMEAVQLAPTAVNQQKYYFTYAFGEVSAIAKFGMYSKIDLGIVKYHFEAVTGRKVK